MNGKRVSRKENPARRLLHDHLGFIEKQCRHAVRRHLGLDRPAETVEIENDSLELTNRVLDHLTADDHRVVRNFQGRAKFTTYLTAIIARQEVEQIRRRRGRDRRQERSRRYGEIGEVIFRRIFQEGCPPGELYRTLPEATRSTLSEASFMDMVQTIRGRPPNPHDDPQASGAVMKGTRNPGDGSLVVVDPSDTPEEAAISTQQLSARNAALRRALDDLSGTERFILRMRFPPDPDCEPERVERIAEKLGLSTKAVYKRISRILTKCRERLQREGIAP